MISPRDIREARQPYSQHTFAKLIGVHPNTLAKWESGVARPAGPAAHLITLCYAFPDLLKYVSTLRECGVDAKGSDLAEHNFDFQIKLDARDYKPATVRRRRATRSRRAAGGDV